MHTIWGKSSESFPIVLKTRSWSLLTTPSKSSPSEAMMGVLECLVVLDEVASSCEKACLCCSPSRGFDAAPKRLVRRPKLRYERRVPARRCSNNRGTQKSDTFPSRRGLFSRLCTCSEAKPTSLLRPPSPFLAGDSAS